MRLRIELLFAIALAGCTTVVGNGVERTADLTSALEPFAGIHTRNGVRVEATVDATRPRQILVTTDDNIVDQLQIFVDIDGALIVRHRSSIDPTIPPVVEVTVPELAFLTADERGTSALGTGIVANERFGGSASGGATLELEGTCGSFVAIASGGSSLDASMLGCSDAHIDALGGSTVRADVSGTLRVRASDQSTVRVTGSPTVVDQQITDGSTLALE